MKADTQPGLFDREQSTEIECHGSELATVCADLKARGAVVLVMVVICPGSYRPGRVWATRIARGRFRPGAPARRPVQSHHPGTKKPASVAGGRKGWQ